MTERMATVEFEALPPKPAVWSAHGDGPFDSRMRFYITARLRVTAIRTTHPDIKVWRCEADGRVLSGYALRIGDIIATGDYLTFSTEEEQ